MDLAAEFYLQTVDTVFVRQALPKGEMTHRGRLVDPSRIKRVALLTVEGEHDDISGVGQTEAAQRSVSQHSARPPGALPAARCRTLRRVQRLALPLGDRAAHFRFRAVDEPNRAAPRASAPSSGASASGVALRTVWLDLRPRTISPVASSMWHDAAIWIRDAPSCRCMRCSIVDRASRRRSKSTSTVRSMRCGCGGTGRRGAIRCASRRRLAKSS